jgi:hypothetical protein
MPRWYLPTVNAPAVLTYSECPGGTYLLRMAQWYLPTVNAPVEPTYSECPGGTYLQ